MSVSWTGVTPPQVDPTKEVKAYIDAVNAGLCTREHAVRSLYGFDFEEVAERLADEKEMLASEDSGTDADTDTDSDTDTEGEDDGNR